MPTFKQVPDAMIAAYAPVTGRLLTRLSRNLKAVAVQSILRPGVVSGTTGSTTWVTVATLRVFIPVDATVRLTMQLLCTKDSGDGAADVRVSVNGSLSNELNLSANTDSNAPGEIVTVDFTSTADTVTEILIQAQQAAPLVTGIQVNMVDGPALGGDYLQPAPNDP